jgi:hypothetical protein
MAGYGEGTEALRIGTLKMPMAGWRVWRRTIS